MLVQLRFWFFALHKAPEGHNDRGAILFAGHSIRRPTRRGPQKRAGYRLEEK
jgi:hypothetical protein